jgi:hypothetical protein
MSQEVLQLTTTAIELLSIANDPAMGAMRDQLIENVKLILEKVSALIPQL